MLLAYEIGMTLIFLSVLVWGLRSRDPINLGAIIGGFMMFGFDWLWCSKGFWNATTDQSLLMIPGIDILGVRYPISICFVWAVGFGFLPLIAAKFYEPIRRALGPLHLPVILLVSAALDIVIEAVFISGIGVWTYNQEARYLLLGVVWSNTWFLGGVLAASYFGLAYVRKWASIPANAGLSLSSETTWKGILMAASTILVPALFLGTLQVFWWSANHPWVEVGRPF